MVVLGIVQYKDGSCIKKKKETQILRWFLTDDVKLFDKVNYNYRKQLDSTKLSEKQSDFHLANHIDDKSDKWVEFSTVCHMINRYGLLKSGVTSDGDVCISITPKGLNLLNTRKTSVFEKNKIITKLFSYYDELSRSVDCLISTAETIIGGDGKVIKKVVQIGS